MSTTSIRNTKRRTQTARREESDRRMLRAAASLFSRQGIRATTLAEIGVEAGYSSGLPVVRFGSKLGLINALIDSMEEWCRTHYAAATAGRRGLDAVKARIEAMIASTRTLPEGSGAFQTFFVEARYGFPELQQRLSTFGRDWRNSFRDDLLQAQRLGEISEDIDCDAYAELIIFAIRGAYIDKFGRNLEELQRRLPRLICDMITQKARADA